MKEADGMLQWTENLKGEINSIAFHKDDIRSAFFGLLYDIGYTFYRGYIMLDLAHFINEGKIMFDESIHNYKIHIDRTLELAQFQELYQSYYNSLNRNLLVSTWSNFELCATTFCDAIAAPNEKAHLLAFQFNEINKKLKKTEINFEDLETLRLSNIKDHLTHVPIIRKTDFLFKKTKNYPRDEKLDKEFLLFLGKFRNTIHTNFIYFGKDYEYQSIYGHFVFKNNQTVKWVDKYNGTPELYFDIMTTLKEIWKALIISIDYKDLIPYPILKE